MASDEIRVERADGVTTITMARAAKKNAITTAMYAAMAEAFRDADSDPGVGAVVLSGEGGVFTAGNDLRDFLDNPPRGPDAPVRRFLDAVAFCRKPVVASVPGLAVGVGATILLHCDLVYASPKARFLTPFVGLGLVPEAASTLLLPRLVGHARAARLLMLGEGIDADTALAWGLASAVVPEDELERASRAAASRLAALPREALLETKRLMRPDPDELAAAMQREFDAFAERLDSAEAKAAFAAFLAR
ncbi:enoyl-CoA hydratase [Alsobacter sp. SYSU M60028]|uniref:Enoyl-CoA hydratase n=1 Tax=Alsobacter ponti TaxID=2962936 RepID=A0ABT1LJ33_9HYPH|nr:enoyl-CoA hydratase [Alsobacter ponti]MCP8940233.1 enoyl-CoA hydratase [Alsobacter ponti]